MGLNCGCPQASALPYVEISACSESIGQVQKVIFQRMYASTGVKNAVASPTIKASWTALMSATGATKAVISPYVQNPSTEPGAARKFGGGNATVNGQEIMIGRESTAFTASMYNVKQVTIAQLKQFMCEEEIGVYLLDEFGRIIGSNSGTVDTPVLSPLQIRSLFVGDKKLGGLEEPDANTIEWSFVPNWSDTMYIVTPTDFNPISDLVNVAPTTTTTTT
jgi:hypothetical protein